LIAALISTGRSSSAVWTVSRPNAHGSCHLEHVRGQTVEVLFIRLDGELGDAPALGRGVEYLTPADNGLVALCCERDGHLELRAGYVLEDDALRRDDFDKDTLVRVAPSVGPVHGEAPGSTGTQVELVERAGESFRTHHCAR